MRRARWRRFTTELTGRPPQPLSPGLVVVICVMVCPWMTGCQEEHEEIRLDFQRTAASSAVVEDDSLCLNVAVSAMTSPQETVRVNKNETFGLRV